MRFHLLVAPAIGLAAALCCTSPVKAAAHSCSDREDRVVSPAVTESIALAPDLRLQRIGTGAYVVRHTCPFVCNSVLVEMPDGTFVFGGTPGFPEAVRLVLDWIEREHGRRPVVAIDSGYHFDNLGGNAAFIAAGFPVYGSDLTVQLLAERGEATRALTLGFFNEPGSPYRAAHAALKFVPPDHVFPIAQGLTLTFGGEEVRVIYPGPTQAPDKVAIYFPGRRLLYGSCMILAGDRPGNTADANLTRWPEAIRELLALPVTAVVPAHGERLDPGLLQHTVEVLERAQAEAKHPAPDTPRRLSR